MALKIVTLCLNGILSALYGIIAVILFFGLWRRRAQAFNLLGLMLALVTLTAGLSYLAHALIIGLSPWRAEKVIYLVLTSVSLIPAALLLALYRRFEAFLGGARLLDETRGRLRERDAQLDSLVELSSELGQLRDLASVLAAALQHCRKRSGARSALFLERETDSEALALSAQLGMDSTEAAEAAASEPVRTLVAQVVATGSLSTQTAQTQRLRHLLALPVRSARGIIGVVVLEGKRDLQPPTQELALWEAVGHQLGIAVESARWFEAQDQLGQELQRRVDEATAELRTSYETLEASEQRLQTVVDNLPVGLLLLDAEDCIAMVNQRVSQLLHLPHARLVRRPLEETELTAEWQTALREPPAPDGPPRELEVAGPSPRIVRVDTAPVTDHQSRRLGRVCVLTDVTRERELDQMKTDFVSLVSHELRTPLTSTLGFVNLLLEGPPDSLSAAQRHSLESIRRQTRRLSTLVAELLDVARFEAGQALRHLERVDLCAVAEGVVRDLAPQAQAKQVAVDLQQPESAVMLRGDLDRLTQVLANLLGNALKFTPEGGQVDLEVRREGAEVVAVVADTGPGLDEEELPHLFDRFYQAGRVVSRRTGGTGLGLYIVKTLVEAHGGTISAANREGGGACFTVRLPRQAPPVEVEPDAAPAPLLLVAEEDPQIAARLTQALQRGGYRALAVNDWNGVALQASAVGPDLIVFRLAPPEGQIAALLQALDADATTRDVPLLAVAAAASPDDVVREAAAALPAGESHAPTEPGAEWRKRLATLFAEAGYTVRAAAAGAADLAAQLTSRLPSWSAGASEETH